MDAGWSPGERNRELGAGPDRKARDVTGCPEYFAGSDRGSLSLVLLVMSEMGCEGVCSQREGQGRGSASVCPKKKLQPTGCDDGNGPGK